MAEPVKKKKKPSQSDLVGIDEEKLTWYKQHQPSGKWRKFTKIKVSYTYVTKKWTYNEKIYSEKFLVPFGMMKTLMGIWSLSKCYHTFNVLPSNVKQKLSIDETDYKPDKMKLELSNKGNKGVKEFTYVYCSVCQTQVNGIIKKHKDRLPSSLTVEDLMSNWDLLSISSELLDLIGCIIPDAKIEPDIYIGLNGRKYLLRAFEHANKFHKQKNLITEKGKKCDVSWEKGPLPGSNFSHVRCYSLSFIK